MSGDDALNRGILAKSDTPEIRELDSRRLNSISSIFRGAMRRTLGLAVLSVVIVGGYLWQVSAESGASALQGAWSVQSVTSPQPPVNQRINPKGLMVISGNHYAEVSVGDTKRPSFAQGGAAKATADQLRAVWGPVIADAVTFTVSGNTIKLTALVVKGDRWDGPREFRRRDLYAKRRHLYV